MGKLQRRKSANFYASEVEHLEKLAVEKKFGLLDRSFCQQVAEELNSCSSGRFGSRVIQVYQVKGWFKKKLTSQDNEITHLPIVPGENAIASGTWLSNNVLEISSDMPKDEEDKRPELDNLKFEAQCSRDLAWYDVSSFLAHRINDNEVEVKVRYAGYQADEDEWVNLKNAVRVRSIPLESSECSKVRVGDLVLCFREEENEAVHFNAHVIEIERKVHDVSGCRCLYLVKYDHDETEEKVHLTRLCRRPKFCL